MKLGGTEVAAICTIEGSPRPWASVKTNHGMMSLAVVGRGFLGCPVERPAPPLAWPVAHSAAEPPLRGNRLMPSVRRFPPPWSVDDADPSWIGDALSSAMLMGRRSPTSISRRSRAALGGAPAHPRRGAAHSGEHCKAA